MTVMTCAPPRATKDILVDIRVWEAVMAHISKTSVEIDFDKLEKIKEITGATSIRQAIDRSWDRLIGMSNQSRVIQEMIEDPYPVELIDPPSIVFRKEDE